MNHVKGSSNCDILWPVPSCDAGARCDAGPNMLTQDDEQDLALCGEVKEFDICWSRGVEFRSRKYQKATRKYDNVHRGDVSVCRGSTVTCPRLPVSSVSVRLLNMVSLPPFTCTACTVPLRHVLFSRWSGKPCVAACTTDTCHASAMIDVKSLWNLDHPIEFAEKAHCQHVVYASYRWSARASFRGPGRSTLSAYDPPALDRSTA